MEHIHNCYDKDELTVKKNKIAGFIFVFFALVILFGISVFAVDIDDYDFLDLLPEDAEEVDELNEELQWGAGQNHRGSAASPRTTESILDITLSPCNSQGDSDSFQTLLTQAQIHLPSEPLGTFYALQGGCTDGTYYYYAFTVNIVNDQKKTEQIDLYLVCATKNGDEPFSIISIKKNLLIPLHHANDMTYNSVNDEIVIAGCSPESRQTVYTVNAALVRNPNAQPVFTPHYVSCRIAAIDYNEKKNCYVIGIAGRFHYFAELDSDFQLIQTFGDIRCYKNISSDGADYDNLWYWQAVYCDDNYVYALHYKKQEYYVGDIKKLVLTFETENRIEIYDWNGVYKKTLYFTVTNGIDRIYEIENMVVVDDHIFLGFNCAKSRTNRYYKYYDLKLNCFGVKYCPDDDVENYMDSNAIPHSFVVRTVPTALYSNTFINRGYAFTGWHACRILSNQTQQWFYTNVNGTKGWYAEGQQPTGYVKYLYSDNQRVSQTAPAGTNVFLCAQWSPCSTFEVQFYPEGGMGTMPTQTVTHGVNTALSNNVFIKTDRIFCGWNAYWREKNKWLYQNSGDSSLKWYVEGTEPAGYMKYVYADNQYVANTVFEGNHVEMHAQWDEYRIYYNASGAIIKSGYILESENGRCLNNWQNAIQYYPQAALYSVEMANSIFNGTPSFDGWHLYRRETDTWLYKNGSSFGWYADGLQPEGYTKYVKKAVNGEWYLAAEASVGEHLILYAAWQ
ncbi:MAG: hypothetical protein IK118_10400 [Clostridia bacterium]|nr:hypothetical protein [Clostridia bacterium]